MNRSLAREIAMKRLYADAVGGADTITDALEQSEAFEQLDEAGKQFSEELYSGAAQRLERIDPVISDHATGWSFDRIAKVDLSILRLATFELLYREDIPNGASINEAVELGKKFGGEKSAKFINGVLGAIAKASASV